MIYGGVYGGIVSQDGVGRFGTAKIKTACLVDIHVLVGMEEGGTYKMKWVLLKISFSGGWLPCFIAKTYDVDIEQSEIFQREEFLQFRQMLV